MISFALVAMFLVLPLALRLKSRLCWNIVFAWDILLSAYTGGQPGESLSGRCGSALLEGKLRGKLLAPIVDLIMMKKGHCMTAVQGDRERAQAVLADYERLKAPSS